MKQISVVTFLVLCMLSHAWGQITSPTVHKIPGGTKVIDGSKLLAKPGDTIELQSDAIFPSLVVKNFHGTAANPIVFTNAKDGRARIIGGDYFTFSFRYCSYIKVTGTGSPGIQYGIEVSSPDPESVGNGIGMGSYCKNIEIDHVEIHEADFAGIMIKTDPKCDLDTQRGHFQIDYINIHDNKIYNVGGEAMYIGYSTYYTVMRDCDDDETNGKETPVLPHEIMDLKIWNNDISETGREGIQIGCTRNYDIYNNRIYNYGKEQLASHQNGVQLGQGCSGTFRNNWIEKGYGHGITVTALENTKIINNIIIDAGITNPMSDTTWTGFNPPSGINMHDGRMLAGENYVIANNTIINPRANGIYMYGNSDIVSTHEFKNNLIMNSGGDFETSRYNAAIYTAYPKKIHQKANFFGGDMAAPKFVDSTNHNYRLQPESFLTDAGVSVISVNEDFDGNTRNYGNSIDIGAFENTNQAAVLDPFPESACHCDHVILQGINVVDGEDYNFLPGETICIEGGRRDKLEIKNIKGIDGNPITIQNCGDAVLVDSGNSIKLDHVEYVRFTGTGVPSIPYGFMIEASNGNAFTINNLSSFFEIDHIAIDDAGNYGIYSKDNPSCDLSSNKGYFSLKDSYIHDVMISNSKRGMQIGHPLFDADKEYTCNGTKVKLYPYEIENLKLSNIKMTIIHGGDGINIYGGKNVLIEDTSLSSIGGVGVYVGNHSDVTLRRNKIYRTKKEGFRTTGSGTARLYTNVFYDAGITGSYSAIKFPFQNAEGHIYGNKIDVQFNTIVKTKGHGIHVVAIQNADGQSIVKNNIFCNPGSTNTTTKAFININASTLFDIDHNTMEREIADMYFADVLQEDFRPTASSPAIDIARNPTEMYDFDLNPRISGAYADAGAFEMNIVSNHAIASNTINKQQAKAVIVYPTEVEEHITIIAKQKDIQLNIYSIEGYLVKTVSMKQSKVTIDLSELKEGMYFVKTFNEGDLISTEKIIKL